MCCEAYDLLIIFALAIFKLLHCYISVILNVVNSRMDHVCYFLQPRLVSIVIALASIGGIFVTLFGGYLRYRNYLRSIRKLLQVLGLDICFYYAG